MQLIGLYWKPARGYLQDTYCYAAIVGLIIAPSLGVATLLTKGELQ